MTTTFYNKDLSKKWSDTNFKSSIWNLKKKENKNQFQLIMVLGSEKKTYILLGSLLEPPPLYEAYAKLFKTKGKLKFVKNETAHSVVLANAESGVI